MNGIKAIAEERLRQIHSEGFTSVHDDRMTTEELVMAGIVMAAPEPIYVKRGKVYEEAWPENWDRGWDKRGKVSRMRLLEICGGLIAAAYDREVRSSRHLHAVG